MVANTVTEILIKFLKTEVASKILLEKPRENVEDEAELVHPAVFGGFIPPKNFLPDDFAVPSIVVGIESETDTEEDTTFKIKLTFAVFAYDGKYDSGDIIENMQGYSDLLHLITTAKTELLTKREIMDTVLIQKPFEWKMYEEQPYPYWYASATFEVKGYSLKYENKFL